MYVYQLIGKRQELMAVLSLPPGYLIVFDGHEIAAIINENNLNLLK